MQSQTTVQTENTTATHVLVSQKEVHLDDTTLVDEKQEQLQKPAVGWNVGNVKKPMKHIQVGDWVCFEIQHQNKIPDDYDGPYVGYEGKVTPESQLVDSSELECEIKVKAYDDRRKIKKHGSGQILMRAGPGGEAFVGTAFSTSTNFLVSNTGSLMTAAHNFVTLSTDGSLKVSTDAIYYHRKSGRHS